MGAAEVISFEEVRARKQWDTLRQQLHARFDHWLDTLEQQWHEPPSTLMEVTAAVWDLRQQLTGGLTETIVKYAHEGECQRQQASCPRCARVLKAQDQVWRTVETMVGPVELERLAQNANSDLVYTFTHPWSDGTVGIRLSPLELLEELAALVPLPRVHLVRYGGCLAPHSHLRGSVIPTPRQQGVDEETDTRVPCWSWARLLKRVFALDMARCPWCQRGALRIIAAITHGEVIRKILRHLKLAADPPPIAPACARQEAFAWSSA